MGIIGSLPLSSETNNTVIPNVMNDSHTESSPGQISHAHLCMKELQSIAAKLENQRRCLKRVKYEGEKTIKHDFRCEKHRQRSRPLKFKNSNIHEQLRNQVQQLETQQTRLLSTITQLYQYKEQLEGVCEQMKSNQELLQ